MKEPKDHSKRTRWGLIVSGLWVGLSVVLAFTVGDGQLKLNELGDFIAGMIAPLAFLWLIIGYFQQGEEIRANTEELERQEQVMREQARAMEIAATSLAEHTRPYITVNFITEGIGVRLVLENIGSRPAQRVQIEYDPPLSEISDNRFDHQNVLSQEFMPPGRKIHAFVHTTIALVQDEKKLETKVSAAYSDLQGNPYSEEFIIALSMGRNEIMQPKSVSYLLDEMGKTLKETNKKLEAIKKTLSPKDISGFP